MKTVTAPFINALTRPDVAIKREVYYKKRYWQESTKTYIWEATWTLLPITSSVTISSVNWQLDTENLSEFKVANVTLVVKNAVNEWKADNLYGFFRPDATAPLGYESYWMKFQIRVGVDYRDQTNELVTIFTGLATEYNTDVRGGTMQITVNGLEQLLINSDAERVSTLVTEENAGTGNGATVDFTTVNTGVGLITLVSSGGVSVRPGTDYTVSQTNSTALGAKITFINAPANGKVIRISYRYWKVTQKFEDLVGYLLDEVGVTSLTRTVDPVIFPSRITNTHLFSTQTLFNAGTKTAIDTTTLVDSLKVDFSDSALARAATTWHTGIDGWTHYGDTQGTSRVDDTAAEWNAGTLSNIVVTGNTLKTDFADPDCRAATTYHSSLSGWTQAHADWISFPSTGVWSDSGSQVKFESSGANATQGSLYRTQTNESGIWEWTHSGNSAFGHTYGFFVGGVASWTPGSPYSGSVHVPQSGYGLQISSSNLGPVKLVKFGTTATITTNQTVLASYVIDTRNTFTIKVVRYPTGRMIVYFDGVAIIDYTDTTYTVSNYFTVYYTSDGTGNPLNLGLGTLYFPSTSVDCQWDSPTLDLVTIPVAWNPFASVNTPSGVTFAFHTRGSPNNSTWDAWVAVSGTTIGSTLRRYVQWRVAWTTSMSGNQDPVITSITVGGGLVSTWSTTSSKLFYNPTSPASKGWAYRASFKGSGRWDMSYKEVSASTEVTNFYMHFMFQSVGTIGVNNFYNGYSVKVVLNGTDAQLKLIRNDSATIGVETEIGSAGITRDTAVHPIRVDRYPNGRIVVFWDNLQKIDVIDTTYTTGNYFGLRVDSSLFQNWDFGAGQAIFIPTDSITSTWVTATIDEGATPDAWSPITYVQDLGAGGSTHYYTRTSANGSTWDAWVSVPANLQIASTLRRYIQLRVDLISATTSNNDPIVNEISSGSITSSTRITLANFTGKTVYQAIQELAKFANYEWGFKPDETFFFRSKFVSITPVLTLDQANFLMMVQSVNNGFGRVYSTVRAIYGSFQTDVSDDAKHYQDPTARFSRQRLQVEGGNLLISADADVASGVAGAFFSYYKKPRRTFKVQSKFLPQLDLSDTVQVSFRDNYPSKLWFLGDTNVYLGQTDINLYGSPEQVINDTLCKVIGMRIDTEQCTTEFDFEEIIL